MPWHESSIQKVGIYTLRIVPQLVHVTDHYPTSGLHVIATARNTEQIKDLESLGMSTLALDVTDSESIASAKTEVEALTGGKLDILVNNAYVYPATPPPRRPSSPTSIAFYIKLTLLASGRNLTLPALDAPLSEARLCFETNFFSVHAITQTFTPLLIAASPSLILNIGSVAAIVPYTFGALYGASKAALHSYSNTLRLELEPYGVRVLVVVTGGVKSRIARTERMLPEGSLYVDIESDFERRVKHSQEGAMETGVYAREVVRQALKGRPKKWFWWGNKAALIKFIDGWVGGWLFDLIMPGMFGLRRLKGILAARKKKV